jgi:hypothetical protein
MNIYLIIINNNKTFARLWQQRIARQGKEMKILSGKRCRI